MIVPIFIDTASLIDQFSSLTPGNVDKICDNIAKTLAAGYAQKLEEEASQALNQTRRRYIEAIKVVDSGKLEGTVLLDYSKDKLVRMIEEGATAFDIKVGLLNSPNVKRTKDGRKYITVPFRVGAPGTIGNSDVFSSIMPKGIYDIVKEAPTTIDVMGGGSRSKGLTIDQLPSQFQTPQTRPEIKDSEGKTLFDAYQNKGPINEGLFKQKDAATGQSTYGNFRRVSESGVSASGDKLGSDKDAFIHKGIETYGLVEKALAKYDQFRVVEVALDNELAKLGFS